MSAHRQSRRASRLVWDVQRPMPFYSVCVSFRNSVEAMVIRRRNGAEPGDRVEPDDTMFWGFRRDDDGPRGFWGHDGGLAGSGVPRRPYPGAGGAEASIIPTGDVSESDELPIATVDRP